MSAEEKQELNNSISADENGESNHTMTDSLAEPPPDGDVVSKRGRGRPKKLSSSTGSVSVQHATSTDDEDSKPKRGRGRPRKYPVKPKTQEDSKPKRGRGRPRKQPSTDEVSADYSEEEKRTPKRGRGRPRKIQKLTESQEITDFTEPVRKKSRGRPKKSSVSSNGESNVPSTRGRGRPPKSTTKMITRSDSSFDDITTKRYKKDNTIRHYPVASRTSIDQEEDENDSSCESDVVYVSDSNEDFDLYLFELPRGSKLLEAGETRGEQLYRERRVPDTIQQNKLLVHEKRIKLNQCDKTDEILSRYVEATKSHFPLSSVENHNNQIVCMDEADQSLLCPTCTRTSCHSYCPIRNTMIELRSTLQWMDQVQWKLSSPNKSFQFTLPSLSDTEKQERIERLQSFLNKTQTIPSSTSTENSAFENDETTQDQSENNTSPTPSSSSQIDVSVIDFTQSPHIINIMDEFTPVLVYMASKLRIYEVRYTRLQRAIYRFLFLLFDEMTEDDARLTLKYCRTLLSLDSGNDVEIIWEKARIEGEIKGKNPSLERLCLFARRIFEYIQSQKQQNNIKNKNIDNNNNSNIDNNNSNNNIDNNNNNNNNNLNNNLNNRPMDENGWIDYDSVPSVSKNDDWGINLQYVEGCSPNPVEDDKKVSLFCVVPSRQLPQAFIKQVTRGLKSDHYTLDISEVADAIDETRIQCFCIAKNEETQTEIFLRADNWASYDIHLFIRISAVSVQPIQEMLISEIKKHFRGHEDIEEHVSILPHNKFTRVMNVTNDDDDQLQALQLQIVTGEDSANYNPSTSISASLDDGTVVLKALISWFNNTETLTNGPTIQYICVKKSHRNQRLASKFIQWFENYLNEIWMPKAKKITYYATFICSAHAFFEKNGFTIIDFYREEGEKTLHRSSPSTSKKSSSSSSSSTTTTKDVEMSTVTGPADDNDDQADSTGSLPLVDSTMSDVPSTGNNENHTLPIVDSSKQTENTTATSAEPVVSNSTIVLDATASPFGNSDTLEKKDQSNEPAAETSEDPMDISKD